MFFLFKRKKKVEPVVEEAAPAVLLETAAPATAAEVQEEVAVAAQKIVLSEDPRKEQLAQIAHDYHDATVRIIRGWLQEDAARSRAAANGAPGTNP
jgi:hypothetical protein